MPCKDCQRSKHVDHTVSDNPDNMDISGNTKLGSKCTSCDSRQSLERSGCSCYRPSSSGRSCRCCRCRSCCSCCSCCSNGQSICAGQARGDVAQKDGSTPKMEEEVTDSCKCCESKQEGVPKKVCASCGCDKCA